MFEKMDFSSNKEENYELILKQAKSLCINDLIADMANISALLNFYLDDINWVGFYLNKNDKLILGPFQGLPACTMIPFEKGVCGYAATNKESIIVSDVNKFPGHIACDSATKSEIVIPILKNNNFIGVLDIDSPIYNRFDSNDLIFLEKITKLLVDK